MSKNFIVQMSKIQMDTSRVLNISFQAYSNDFTFIVNGEEFQTSRVISDIISPVINNIHLNDPTIDTFTINTTQKGHFSYILNLISFNEISIPKEEEEFFIEVIEQLGNDKININNSNNDEELSTIFTQIKFHEKYSKIYKNRFSDEVKFISKHFYELTDDQINQLKKLKLSTLYDIFSDDQLLIQSEDQLLKIVNELYSEKVEYSILYETINFLNVSIQMMNEFISLFNYEDMTTSTWNRICERLSIELKIESDKLNTERYKKENNNTKNLEFLPTFNDTFNGIINHLRQKSNGIIENEINVKSSSFYTIYIPKNVLNFDDFSYFYSKEEKNSWLSIDFKNHKIIPTHYQIKSCDWSRNSSHPKNWVIECSNDEKNWETIDQRSDCYQLNGRNLTHTFGINQSNGKSFRFIRIRLNGRDCRGDYFLTLKFMEH